MIINGQQVPEGSGIRDLLRLSVERSAQLGSSDGSTNLAFGSMNESEWSDFARLVAAAAPARAQRVQEGSERWIAWARTNPGAAWLSDASAAKRHGIANPFARPASQSADATGTDNGVSLAATPTTPGSIEAPAHSADSVGSAAPNRVRAGTAMLATRIVDHAVTPGEREQATQQLLSVLARSAEMSLTASLDATFGA